MHVMIDILHPAHVHFFRHIRDALKKKHKVTVVARDKEVSIELLHKYRIPYYTTTTAAQNPLSLARELLKRMIMINRFISSERPDILMGISGTSIVPVGRLRGIPTIVFTDTEDAGLAGIMSYSLADRVVTPSCFAGTFGAKHVRYNGYQELAYLHPDYYKPNPTSLSESGLTEEDEFYFLRFTSFSASHDIGQSGFSSREKLLLARYLSKRGRVVISSEGKLPRELLRWKYCASASMVHDYLYYARMFIGDSQTMSTEASLLGTPAIRCNSLVGTQHGAGNYHELEHKYDLLYSFSSPTEAFAKLQTLIDDASLTSKCAKKHQRLL